MIDLTKPLEKPIRAQFLDNVLDAVDTSEITDDDLGSLDLDELERMAAAMGITDEDLEDKVDEEDEEETSAFGGRVASLSDLLSDSGEGTSSMDGDAWYIKRDNFGREIPPKFEEGDIYKKIAIAPIYLIQFVVLSAKRRTKEDLPQFIKALFLVSSITFIVSFILLITTRLKFIISFKTLAIVSLVVGLMTKLYLIQIENEYKKEELEEIEEEIEEIEELELEEELEEEYYDDDEEEYYDDDEEEYDEEENDYELLRKEYEENLPLKENIVDVKISQKMYDKKLIKALEDSENYRYSDSTIREDIINSLNNYIICNNPGFADFKRINRGTTTYNNICYLIYEGLRVVFDGLTLTGEHTMQVQSLTENKLFYRLEVTLPRLVKMSRLTSNIQTIESKFKANETDEDVSIQVSHYGNNFIFKILKTSNVIVTWGDVIRYYEPRLDIRTYEDFMNEDKYDMPILIGLQNEEKPLIFDMAENTSVAIAGTSGSGKSWAVFSFMFNLIIQHHPGDVSFAILDYKRDPQYRALARLPHVLGFHHDIDTYNDLARELVTELDRRKSILDAMGVSKWQELRANFKDDPDKLHRFPWLFVIVEETAAVLSSLETASKKTELKDEFIRNLKEIAKQGRSLGMRIVMISQRTTDKELPRDIESECGVKLCFQLKDADLERVDMKPVNTLAPTRKGSALFKDVFHKEPIIIKTLGIGGTNDKQILNLTRMLAFEWHLRIDEDLYYSNFSNLNLVDNRRERREEVLEDLENKQYFGKDIQNIDINDLLNQVYRGEEIVIRQEGEKVAEGSNKKNNDRAMNIEDKNIEKRVEIRATGKKETFREEVKEKLDVDELDREKKKREIEKLLNVNQKEIRTSNLAINTQSKVTRQGVVEDNNVKEYNLENIIDDEKMTTKMSVGRFIRQYGEGETSKKMTEEMVREHYTNEEIREALSDLDIIRDGDYLIS